MTAVAEAEVRAHVEQVELVIKLPPVEHSSGIARMFVGHHLLTRGGACYVDSAERVVAELVSNALFATWDDMWLRVMPSPGDGGRPVIELWDSCPIVPSVMWEANAEDPARRLGRFLEAERGRGLAVVGLLSEAWGIRLQEWRGIEGKVVWAVLKDPEDSSDCAGAQQCSRTTGPSRG